VIAPLDHLADAGDARGLQQLAELGELLVATVGYDRDQECSLAGAALPVIRQRLIVRLMVSH
jgi:hypothetical protein